MNVINLRLDDAFEAFWAVCPKKVGKMIARIKFEAIISDAGLRTRVKDNATDRYIEDVHLKAAPEQLIEAMKAYARTQYDVDNRYELRDGGRYTLHPATWLNKGRWLD